MIGSFAGLFCAPVLELFIKDNPYRLLISFLVGCVFGVIYLCLVFRYVRQTHSIYAFLRSDEILWRTCAYLASLRGNNIVNNYKLLTLDVNYKLEEPVINSTGVLTYPFSVEYVVKCSAIAPLSEVYYHTVGATHKNEHIKVEYVFDNGEYLTVGESNYLDSKSSISFYKLCAETCWGKSEPFSYRIKISFDKERGIPVIGKQRILFDPTNFSTNSKGVRASVKINCPASIEEHFDKLHIQQYVDGLNQIPNASQLRMTKRDYADKKCEYTSKVVVEDNRLYAVMFVAKEQS